MLPTATEHFDRAGVAVILRVCAFCTEDEEGTLCLSVFFLVVLGASQKERWRNVQGSPRQPGKNVVQFW